MFIDIELYDVLTQLFGYTQCFFDVDPLSEYHPYLKTICIVTFSYNELIYSLIIIMLSGLIIHMIFLDNPICTRCQENLVQIEELRRELEVTQKVKLNEMLNSIISPDPADRLTGPIKGIINETGEPRIPEIFQYYDTLIPSEMNY